MKNAASIFPRPLVVRLGDATFPARAPKWEARVPSYISENFALQFPEKRLEKPIETLDQSVLLPLFVPGKAQAHGRYRKRSRLSEERRAIARIEAALDVDVLEALQ
jgi:hypothetical protein